MLLKPSKVVAFTSMIVVMSRTMIDHDTSAQYHISSMNNAHLNQMCSDEFIKTYFLKLCKSTGIDNSNKNQAQSFIQSFEIIENFFEYVKYFKNSNKILKVEAFPKFFEALKLQLKDFEASKDSSFALKNPEFSLVFDMIKNHSNTIKSIAIPLVEFSIPQGVLKSIPKCANIGDKGIHNIYTLIFMKILRNKNIFIPADLKMEKSLINEYNNLLDKIFNIYEREMGFTEIEQNVANELFMNPNILHLKYVKKIKKFAKALALYDNPVIETILYYFHKNNKNMDLSVKN